MKANEFVKKFGWNAAKYKADELKIFNGLGGELSIEDTNLIRLVRSHEIVQSFGGLQDAKTVSKMGKYYKYLKQAIADVESCQ